MAIHHTRGRTHPAVRSMAELEKPAKDREFEEYLKTCLEIYRKLRNAYYASQIRRYGTIRQTLF